MLNQTLYQEYPESGLQLVNKGICGNSIEGLQLRWERDVLAKKPDWLFCYVGINDAHVTLNHQDTVAQRIKSFSAIYSELILKTASQLPLTKLTLITPFLLGSSPHDKITTIATAYVNAVRTLSQTSNLSLLDLQELFDSVVEKHPSGYWSVDGVHPTPAGHQLIADAIFDFLTE